MPFELTERFHVCGGTGGRAQNETHARQKQQQQRLALRPFASATSIRFCEHFICPQFAQRIPLRKALSESAGVQRLAPRGALEFVASVPRNTVTEAFGNV